MDTLSEPCLGECREESGSRLNRQARGIRIAYSNGLIQACGLPSTEPRPAPQPVLAGCVEYFPGNIVYPGNVVYIDKQ